MLRVAAAAVVADGRLLLVSKQAAPDVFYLPGGKPEGDEPAGACVRRELREELGVSAARLSFLEQVNEVAALEGVPMAMDVFLASLDGEPAPAAEIAALGWYRRGRRFRGTLAPAIANVVIPSLGRRGLL